MKFDWNKITFKKGMSFLNRNIRYYFDRLSFFKLINSYYFLFRGKLYSAPTVRQAKILRGYINGNLTKIRESIPLNLLGLVIDKSNPVILDIGGNIGYNSILYSKLLSNIDSGMCFTFEPLSLNRHHISRNIKGLSNIYLLPFGLSDSFAIVPFDIPEYVFSYKKGKDLLNTGLISAKGLRENKSSLSDKGLIVPLDSFNSFFNKINANIIYIKIDVEGMELSVILGALDLLKMHTPIIQYEYNPKTNSENDIINIYSKLKEIGYQFFSTLIFQIGNECEIYCFSEDFVEKFSKELQRFGLIKIELK